jgi:hypothetical protein
MEMLDGLNGIFVQHLFPSRQSAGCQFGNEKTDLSRRRIVGIDEQGDALRRGRWVHAAGVSGNLNIAPGRRVRNRVLGLITPCPNPAVHPGDSASQSRFSAENWPRPDWPLKVTVDCPDIFL